MTDENLQDVSPAEGAPALPVEAEHAAPPTATDQATESPADDAGEDAKPRGVGKRIDELTRNWREAERREAALLALLSQRDAPAPPKAAEPPAKEPELADYEYDEGKFKVALANHYAAQARAAAESVIAERERAAAERAKAQTFKQKEAEFKSKTPDYETVAYYAPISNEVVELVRESEIGPEVAYYLGKNPELAQTISQLPEKAAAREIGRIEARLQLQKETAKAQAQAPLKPAVSQAPPPPPKIDAVEPEVSKDPDQMTTTEWLKWRNKQLSRKKA